jgi:hypothetical protein
MGQQSCIDSERQVPVFLGWIVPHLEDEPDHEVAFNVQHGSAAHPGIKVGRPQLERLLEQIAFGVYAGFDHSSSHQSSVWPALPKAEATKGLFLCVTGRPTDADALGWHRAACEFEDDQVVVVIRRVPHNLSVSADGLMNRRLRKTYEYLAAFDPSRIHATCLDHVRTRYGEASGRHEYAGAGRVLGRSVSYLDSYLF